MHEILNLYKLNNLHVLIFSHVVCFNFACYSSILVGAVQLSQYNASPVQCQDFINLGGGGWGRFKEFSGSRGDDDLWGVANFQDPGRMAYVGQ